MLGNVGIDSRLEILENTRKYEKILVYDVTKRYSILENVRKYQCKFYIDLNLVIFSSFHNGKYWKYLRFFEVYS